MNLKIVNLFFVSVASYHQALAMNAYIPQLDPSLDKASLNPDHVSVILRKGRTRWSIERQLEKDKAKDTKGFRTLDSQMKVSQVESSKVSAKDSNQVLGKVKNTKHPAANKQNKGKSTVARTPEIKLEDLVDVLTSYSMWYTVNSYHYMSDGIPFESKVFTQDGPHSVELLDISMEPFILNGKGSDSAEETRMYPPSLLAGESSDSENVVGKFFLAQQSASSAESSVKDQKPESASSLSLAAGATFAAIAAIVLLAYSFKRKRALQTMSPVTHSLSPDDSISAQKVSVDAA